SRPIPRPRLSYCLLSSLTLASSLIIASFFFSCYRDPRDLHSFPTRRSSDLLACRQGGDDSTFPDGEGTGDLSFVPQSSGYRSEPDRGQPRGARGPVVEPGGGEPGDRPGLPYRPAAQRAGAHDGLRGDREGTGGRDAHAQERAGRQRGLLGGGVADRPVGGGPA